MAAAIPWAEPPVQERLTLHLLQRQHPEGLVALTDHFDRLPPQVQQLVVDHAAQMDRSIRESASRAHGPGPLNALTLIRRAAAIRLAYLPAQMLRRGREDVRPIAGACLQELSQCADQDSAANVQYLLTALGEALACYPQHRQPQVLHALLHLTPRPLPLLLGALDTPRHPALEPLRTLLERDEAPHVAAALLSLLPVASLTFAVLRRLQRAGSQQQWSDLLRDTHLLLAPRVARSLQSLIESDSLLPTPEAVEALPADAACAAPRWIMAVRTEPPRRIELLARLNHATQPRARLAALRALIEQSRDPLGGSANDVLATFTHDEEAPLARAALRHLIRRDWPGLTALAIRLTTSPHEAVRRLASSFVSRRGFERMWQAWPKLDDTQRLAAGRALIKLDPLFHQQLAARLERADRPSLLRALSIIELLGQGALFESALAALIHAPDEVAAASAVKAMGQSTSEVAQRCLESALSHADARVRANAVEALDQVQRSRHVRRLVEMATHDENRPRANAIGALLGLRLGEALPALGQMLADAQPASRRSALWLVQHMGLVEVARHVAEMSLSDPDIAVRRRAAEVVEQLIHQMRSPQAPDPKRGAA